MYNLEYYIENKIGLTGANHRTFLPSKPRSCKNCMFAIRHEAREWSTLNGCKLGFNVSFEALSQKPLEKCYPVKYDNVICVEHAEVIKRKIEKLRKINGK